MFDILFSVWLLFMFVKVATIGVFLLVCLLAPGILFANYLIEKVRNHGRT